MILISMFKETSNSFLKIFIYLTFKLLLLGYSQKGKRVLGKRSGKENTKDREGEKYKQIKRYGRVVTGPVRTAALQLNFLKLVFILIVLKNQNNS